MPFQGVLYLQFPVFVITKTVNGEYSQIEPKNQLILLGETFFEKKVKKRLTCRTSRTILVVYKEKLKTG